MNNHANAVRASVLYNKLKRKIFNISCWWGISPTQVIEVLNTLMKDLATNQQAGTLDWPDPNEARYCPGMTDDELRVLAHYGALELAGSGTAPSQRNVWAWCKAKGAKKRQRDALRVIQGLLNSLSAEEAPPSVVHNE